MVLPFYGGTMAVSSKKTTTELPKHGGAVVVSGEIAAIQVP